MGFLLMLLGIEHLMRNVLLAQQIGNDFGVFNRGGPHQYRLTAVHAATHIFGDRHVFFGDRQIHQVAHVIPGHRLVGRNADHFQIVDLVKFGRLGVGGSGHARELGVETEVVLEGNGGQRLVFVLNRDALLRFHCLMQSL